MLELAPPGHPPGGQHMVGTTGLIAVGHGGSLGVREHWAEVGDRKQEAGAGGCK